MEHAIEQQVPIRNDLPGWTCQDYVLEVLDMLEEEWWLDANNQEYLDVKKKLKAMKGPIELVQTAVLTYSKTTTSFDGSEGDPGGGESTETKKGRVVQFVDDLDGD